MKRILSLILLLTFLPLTLPAHALETSATAAILLDASTGNVLYEKNADKQMLIASTTKIMTALVALRDGKLTDTVTVSRNAAATEGSSMYLKAGETLSLEALLYGLMLSSGNDAAVAIAEHIAGSVSAFAERMNVYAQSLGMWNSSFANPHGLNHPNHYSTARDMAKLANAAMENETLRRITSTSVVTLAGRTMKNHNKLLGTLEGCIGLKTGYTKAAGRTLVTCCERNGRRLIAVTLKDGDDWNDHRKMYEYGFATPWEPSPAPDEPLLAWPTPETANLPNMAPAAPRNLTVTGNFLGEAPVTGGNWSTVPLVSAETMGVEIPAGADVSVRLELDKPLTAPLAAGEKVGVAVFLFRGMEWGRVDALCGEDVPAASEVPAPAVTNPAALYEPNFNPEAVAPIPDAAATYRPETMTFNPEAATNFNPEAASVRPKAATTFNPEAANFNPEAAAFYPKAANFNPEALYEWERLPAALW